MPEIAKNVVIDRKRNTLIVDGVEFPWVIGEPGPKVEEYGDDFILGRVTIPIFAERITVDNESTAIGTSAFANAVATRRQQMGWTQVELLARLAEKGVILDSSAITRIEKGQREPRLSEALAFSDIFRISLDELR